MIANALFWNFIANKTGFANTASLNQKINIPFVMNILVGTFVAAFYEEIVYRVYLPSYTLSIINKVNLSEKLQKNIQYFFEVLIVILFAISHSYAGLPAVMNAFFAGIVLRLYIIKKMGIIFITIVHFLYNLLWLIKIF
ncbi:MAG: CPBP family intramembrane metalloprotease [Spirochaetaceae bacterium]|nr:CPBP family intramembrane metalloprotease [Spirochaetaceae bacterium]